MFNDLEEAIKEEQYEYSEEEIQKIQDRARMRADELMTKIIELVSAYLVDPEAENESETSAIYVATVVDRYSELWHNAAPTQELQKRTDNVIKELFQ